MAEAAVAVAATAAAVETTVAAVVAVAAITMVDAPVTTAAGVEAAVETIMVGAAGAEMTLAATMIAAATGRTMVADAVGDPTIMIWLGRRTIGEVAERMMAFWWKTGQEPRPGISTRPARAPVALIMSRMSVDPADVGLTIPLPRRTIRVDASTATSASNQETTAV